MSKKSAKPSLAPSAIRLISSAATFGRLDESLAALPGAHLPVLKRMSSLDRLAKAKAMAVEAEALRKQALADLYEELREDWTPAQIITAFGGSLDGVLPEQPLTKEERATKIAADLPVPPRKMSFRKERDDVGGGYGSSDY